MKIKKLLITKKEAGTDDTHNRTLTVIIYKYTLSLSGEKLVSPYFLIFIFLSYINAIGHPLCLSVFLKSN